MFDKNFVIKNARLTLSIFTLLAVLGYLLSYGIYYNLTSQNKLLTNKILAVTGEKKSTQKKLSQIGRQLDDLKKKDQYLINQKLEKECISQLM